MKISEYNLSYCLNAFDFSEDWKNKLNQVDLIFNKVRKNLDFPEKETMGLGLWTSADFLEIMQEDNNIKYLQDFFKRRKYTISTINAFPYGIFHNQPVKDKVYLPNWLDEKRLGFTKKAAAFLEKFLPEKAFGSISTLPGLYKKHVNYKSLDILKQIATNLKNISEYLAYLYESTGKKIRIGVEMEPDCLWETPDEFIRFYNDFLSTDKYASEYIGVCYDTCHQELIESAPGEGICLFLKNDVPIVKIQLSAALEIKNPEYIKIFNEPVYLHQTRIFNKENGKIKKVFLDIPDVKWCLNDKDILKCHFHLPIFLSEQGECFASSRKELQAILSFLKNNLKICQDIEIETYTYSVLPDCIDNSDISTAVSEEYKWVIKCLM